MAFGWCVSTRDSLELQMCDNGVGFVAFPKIINNKADADLRKTATPPDRSHFSWWLVFVVEFLKRRLCIGSKQKYIFIVLGGWFSLLCKSSQKGICIGKQQQKYI